MTAALGSRIDVLKRLDELGFAIVESVLSRAQVDGLLHGLSASRPGTRRAAQTIPAVKQLIEASPVRQLAHEVLGPRAFLTRSILFNKTSEANWGVPWHRDLTIPVRQRVDVEGFGPWSIKEGILHVQAPPSVLQRMLTIRLHLDDCGEDNGPLQVRPGSHRIDGEQHPGNVVLCTLKRGDVLLMKPLLLHASSSAKQPAQRRILHLEFASDPLPGGLEWDHA